MSEKKSNADMGIESDHEPRLARQWKAAIISKAGAAELERLARQFKEYIKKTSTKMGEKFEDEPLVVTWEMIKEKLHALNLPPGAKVYGVPRGGAYLSAMLNPVDHPEDADLIIDDIMDSGATAKKYKIQFPNTPFYALLEKGVDVPANKWVVFPWEQNDPPEGPDLFLRLLQWLEVDTTTPDLKETPARFVKAMQEMITQEEFIFTTFDAGGMDEMIIEKDIPFYSLCEHHVLPFMGTATVAYIPGERIAGLSKIARAVRYYAKGLNTQEKMTQAIARGITDALNPRGVAVVVKARHLCMEMRGVKAPGVETFTSCMTGVFHPEQGGKAREEFLQIIKTQ